MRKIENIKPSFSWLKYILMAILVIYVAVISAQTRGSDQSFSVVKKAVEDQLEKKEMKDAGENGLKRYYSLNPGDYEGVMMYVATSNMSAQEILLIKVKDENQVEDLESVIEKRLETRKKDFDGYAPKQAKLVDDAQFMIRGNYVFLAISEHAEEYADIFKESL